MGSLQLCGISFSLEGNSFVEVACDTQFVGARCADFVSKSCARAVQNAPSARMSCLNVFVIRLRIFGACYIVGTSFKSADVLQQYPRILEVQR